MEKMEAKHRVHDKINHPMTKDQLEEVWEEQDHMDPKVDSISWNSIHTPTWLNSSSPPPLPLSSGNKLALQNTIINVFALNSVYSRFQEHLSLV